MYCYNRPRVVRASKQFPDDEVRPEHEFPPEDEFLPKDQVRQFPAQ